MRKKYIRFFISSTFDDMKKERNLLQEVLNKLAKEYSQHEWQIEAVDLRWGISEEAGLDNKTMQICKEEIERCQQLSPKPNFIILLGNRYGWIPLPETISPTDFNIIQNNPSISKESKEIFRNWYKIDENAIPDGEYILQRRTGKYIDHSYWEEEVVKPLSELFKIATKDSVSKDLYGHSATEMEIQMGALSIDDAHEHVIAYFRDITDISNLSNDIQKHYYEFGDDASVKLEKLEELKTNLNNKIGKNNSIDLQLKYEQYLSDQYDNIFKIEIEKHLRAVIKNVISSYNDKIWENNIHLSIAAEEAKSFVGREKDIKFIDRYISNESNHKILWIKSESGSGKSALLAKVANRYFKTHDIICRFCGRTHLTLNSEDLITTLWLDLNNLDTVNRDNNPNAFYPIWKQFQEQLEGNINKLKGKTVYNKPVLIIIDAIDQVDKEGTDEFNSFFPKMSWLDCELADNVKVIISSTNELRFNIDNPHFDYYQLDNMGDDSMLMIDKILHNNKRSLTEQQYQDISNVIAHSNKSAIYLQILGNYLCRITSMEDLKEIPYELSALVSQIVEDLSKPERHGKIIVSKVLSWLAFEEIGFTQDEILDLLSSDEEFLTFFENNSKQELHIVEEKKIPVIIWIRLMHDILPFLRVSETNIGITISIFHNELKRIIGDYFANTAQEKEAIVMSLYQYYKRKSSMGNKHALLELIRCGHSTAVYSSHFNNNLFNVIRTELFDFLSNNLDFITTKLKTNKRQLDIDYKKVYNLYNTTDNNTLKTIKDELFRAAQYTKEKEQLFALLINASQDSILRKIIRQKYDTSFIMDNILSGCFKSCAIHHISELGENACMSEDGNIVASLFDNRHLIKVENLSNPTLSKSYTLKDPILQIQFNDNLCCFAIKFSDSCLLFDITESKTIYNKKIPTNGWISLSQNGNFFAHSDEKGINVYKIGGKETCLLDIQAKSGRLDSTGVFLWIITNDNHLYCYNIEDDLVCEFPIIENKGESVVNPLEETDYRIADCTDCRCLLNDTKGNSYLIGYNVKGNTYRYKILNAIRLNKNNQQVLIDNRNNYQIIQYDLSNHHTMVSSISISSFICVNSDFTRALTKYNILDLESLMQKFTPNQGGLNSGLNGLSSNNHGDEISVSTGINENFDFQQDIMRITDKKCYKWYPPFLHEDYSYVACTAISPDGRLIAAASCGGGQHQIVLCTINGQKIASFDSKEPCISIMFTEDSEYLIGITGHRLYEPTLWIHVIDRHGNQLISKDLGENITWPKLSFSNNNRYAYIDNIVFDMISNIYSKQGSVLSNKNSVEVEHKYKWVIEESCLYLIQNNREKEILLEDVNDAIPALDCDHIYLVKNDGTILLYNINTQEIEQKAFWGKELVVLGTVSSSRSSLLFKACAKGLIVVNHDCEVALFKPSDTLNVNRPAVTKFIRRWNLTTKEQEEPTAICPMCGSKIEITSVIYKTLIDHPAKCKSEDWDNPDLFGHYCRYCHAELRFNPYII